jgi:hypothetical protein
MAHLHRLRRAEDPGATARFAAVASSGLATFGPPRPGGPDLALELGLSAWMRLAGVGTAEARAALLALREAVVGAAGLDPASEPVPFIGRDPRQDTLILAAYLCDLLIRAARVSGVGHQALVAGALERLEA